MISLCIHIAKNYVLYESFKYAGKYFINYGLPKAMKFLKNRRLIKYF